MQFCYCGISNNKIDNVNECQLSAELKQEIHSYEAVANKIIEEIVHGKFKGHTYDM